MEQQKALKLTKEVYYIFIEIFLQMLETEKQLTTELQKMNILGSAIANMKDGKTKTENAGKEIEKIPETTKIYRPVGRM